MHCYCLFVLGIDFHDSIDNRFDQNSMGTTLTNIQALMVFISIFIPIVSRCIFIPCFIFDFLFISHIIFRLWFLLAFFVIGKVIQMINDFNVIFLSFFYLNLHIILIVISLEISVKKMFNSVSFCQAITMEHRNIKSNTPSNTARK